MPAPKSPRETVARIASGCIAISLVIGLLYLWHHFSSPSQESSAGPRPQDLAQVLPPLAPNTLGRRNSEKANAATPSQASPMANKISTWELNSDSLKDMVLAGKLSSDPILRFRAMRILTVCEPFIQPSSVEPLFPNQTSEEWKRLLSARSNLRHWCQTLNEIGRSGAAALAEDLRSSLSERGSGLLSKFEDLPRNPSDAQIADLRSNLAKTFRTDGALAIEWASPGLLDWLQFASSKGNILPKSSPLNNTETLASAMAIAPCFMGTSCDASSAYYSSYCAGVPSCKEDMITSVLHNLATESQRGSALAQARLIAMSIVSGNLGTLGIE